MNTTLIVFVVLYVLGTLALGVWAGTRIKNTTDFTIAGRSLPLIMVVTTTFATWFGAETVMGIPAKFVQGGLSATVEDPFGAGNGGVPQDIPFAQATKLRFHAQVAGWTLTAQQPENNIARVALQALRAAPAPRAATPRSTPT